MKRRKKITIKYIPFFEFDIKNIIIIIISGVLLLSVTLLIILMVLFNNKNKTYIKKYHYINEDIKSIKSASEEKLEELIEVINKNSPIYFKSDTADLFEGEEDKVLKITKELNRYHNIKLILEGHTADSGESRNEMKLSMRRAETVRKIIVKNLNHKKINMTLKAFGSTKKAITDPEYHEKKYNRRVEIKVEK